MTPKPLPPDQIKTPRGIGINESDGGARTGSDRWIADQLAACGQIKRDPIILSPSAYRWLFPKGKPNA